MRINQDPKIWGANAWQFLEDCGRSIDDDSLAHYNALLRLLPTLLPCENCRNHCSTYLTENDVPATPEDILPWISAFRQEIRSRKAKASPRIPLLFLFLFALLCLLMF